MAITVYSISGAPRAWRVLLGLTFKGIDHNTILLEASKGEHKSPEYLDIHPRGTVPAMDVNGLILRDSIGILAWLDRQYPDRPLFGATPDEAALVWQITLESCDYFRAATDEILMPLLVEGKSVPKAGSVERIAMQASAGNLQNEYQWLEHLLGENSFLAGDAPSAADAVCFPEIRLIERAIDTKYTDMKALDLASMAKRYPRLEAWKTRVSKLPGVDKTMPPHWAEST